MSKNDAIGLRIPRPPPGRGLATGTGLWLFVDEGASYALGLTPPATEYPLATHARGLVGHAAYGLALGSLLGVGQRVLLRSGPVNAA